MKYLCTIYTDESRMATATPEDIAQTMAAYEAFGREVSEKGRYRAGDGLQPTSAATTVRVRDGKPCSPTGRSRRRRSSSAASTCSSARISTKRSSGRRRFRGAVRLDRGPTDHGLRRARGRGAASDGSARETLGRGRRAGVPARVGTRGRDPHPVLGDFELAEDALQDAFATALERWPARRRPGQSRRRGSTTARHRAIDRLRRERRYAREAAPRSRRGRDEARRPDEPTDTMPDDRLRLVFTCCHPALSLEAQVALTLRTLGGLTTTEIARAFLVPEATMASASCGRSARSATPGIPYEVPRRPRAAGAPRAVLASST